MTQLGPYPPPRLQILNGSSVHLSPMSLSDDAAGLYAASHGSAEKEALWEYLPAGPFLSVEDFSSFYQSWLSKPDVLVFTIRRPSGSILGSLSLLSIRPEHGVAEIGLIWYAPEAQRTKINTECCSLLLGYLFDSLGYRRVEWKCDALNERSQRAAMRLGFLPEGLFRQHMVRKGQNRDTAWFSIIDREWPTIKKAQDEWLRSDGCSALQARKYLG